MKRDWWNRLLLRDPEHANQFLQLSGWEKDSLEAFLAPVFSSETEKRAAERRVWVKKFENADFNGWTTLLSSLVEGRLRYTATLAGLRGIRIGEAAVPGPKPKEDMKLSFLSINSGGAPGAWKILNENFLGAAVVAIQDLGMTCSEWEGFARLSKKKGYHAYRQKGATEPRPRGGVAFLIHRSVRHRFAMSPFQF